MHRVSRRRATTTTKSCFAALPQRCAGRHGCHSRRLPPMCADPNVRSPNMRNPNMRDVRWVARALAPAFAAALMASCSVGPDFENPTGPEVTGYTRGRMATSTVSAAVTTGGDVQRFLRGRDIPGEWWRMFGSAALKRLELALENNPDLMVAQASLQVAQHNPAPVMGAFFPAVDGNFGASRQRPSSGGAERREPAADLQSFYRPGGRLIHAGRVRRRSAARLKTSRRRRRRAFPGRSDLPDADLEHRAGGGAGGQRCAARSPRRRGSSRSCAICLIYCVASVVLAKSRRLTWWRRRRRSRKSSKICRRCNGSSSSNGI